MKRRKKNQCQGFRSDGEPCSRPRAPRKPFCGVCKGASTNVASSEFTTDIMDVEPISSQASDTVEGTGTGNVENTVKTLPDAAPEGWPEGRKPPTGMSASSLALYSQCERRFAYEKIERLPSPPNTAAAAGTQVHRVLQYLMSKPKPERTVQEARNIHQQLLRDIRHYERQADQAENPDDVFDTISDRGFRSLVSDYYHSGAEWETFVQKSTQGVEGYFNLKKSDPTAVDVIACEQSVNLVIDTPHGKVPVRGEIDRLDALPEHVGGGVRVVDYKNGKLQKAFGGLDKYREQVGLYAIMVEEDTGERPKAGALVFTSEDEIVAIKIDDTLLDGVREKVGHAWKDIHEKMDDFGFEPTSGALCGWCPFVDRCPEGKEEVTKRAEKGVGRGGLRADAPARATLNLPAPEENT